MAPWTLSEVERAVQKSWAADTCDPHDLDEWCAANPSRGQCGVTALVLHDLFGGALLLGEVYVGRARTGHHWWNAFGGIEVDLTRGQFRAEERVTGGRIVERPPGPPRRLREQYEILRTRVFTRLDARENGSSTMVNVGAEHEHQTDPR